MQDKKIHPNNEGRGKIEVSKDKFVRIRKSDIAKLKKELPKKTEIGKPDISASAPKKSDKDENLVITENGIVPILEENSNEISVPLSAESIWAFKEYARILRQWNEVMNLTNIVDDNGIAMRHFIDSLTIIKFIEAEQVKQGKKDLTIIDVGTGAGFPGIPVKVVATDLKLTLLDSLKKRIGFLDEVVKTIGLQNVKTVHSRAEDAGHDSKLREKYDIATARAVAALPVLCEYCLPFVKEGGIFLAMKGHIDEELEESGKAIEKLGGKIETVEKFVLPGTDMDRAVVVIRKVKPTPKQYPRQAGKPSKEPIK
ncbi:MAG: 16S rRNA (guanine(527)-N(7))-methyltransferase RsmG [Clostridia bacterium]|nr:16S rRNA (guanine(527)-N(7))-methyltransferase RsmG [Clostridia bacterium]